MGDINLDYLCKGFPSYKKLKLLERTYQLHQCIKSPTRVSLKSSSLIDHIYTNSHLVSKAGTISINSSDPYPCYIIRKKPKGTKFITSFKCRKLKHFHAQFYRNRLEDLDWRPFYEKTDPNVAWDILLCNILSVLDTYYPEVEINNVPARASWLTSEIFELILKRDDAFETARISKNPKDWEFAKKMRNSVVDICSCAKNEFTHTTLEENNPKKFWSKLNNIWGDPKKRKDSNDNCVLRDPLTLSDGTKSDTPNIFNKFFCTVASNLQLNIKPLSHAESLKLSTDNENAPNKSPNLCIPAEKFAFRDITTAELKLLIKKIEKHKNSGIKGLSSALFKITAKILLPQFRFLFNLCIRTSTFPTKWKNTIITPLFKAGDLKDPGNYRPIACIPLPSKLLEKCLHSQLNDYLENSEQLSNVQFGFRKGRSTNQAIFSYLDHIYNNINNNLNTLAVYVDFKKAFDTVYHLTLLDKLKELNISNTAINLFHSYLTNRAQQVHSNKTLSSPDFIKTGVPQGSTLGPLLFIIYINSLPSQLKHSKCLLFADDTVIFHSSDNFNNSFNVLQTDLDRLHVWCRKNLLEVNASKTKVAFFTSKHLNSTTKPYKKLTLGHTDLDYVNEYKYLGVTIDTSLTFKKHISIIIKSITHKAYQLQKIRNCLSSKIALQLYKSMILPVIDYGDIFYHNKCSGLLNKLQVIRQRCIQTISKLPKYTNTSEEERKLNLLKLTVRRALHIYQFAHETIINNPHLLEKNQANRPTSLRKTRSQNPIRNQFSLFRPTKTLIEKSITYAMRHSWNNLPTSAHDCADNHMLTTYLLANPDYLHI